MAADLIVKRDFGVFDQAEEVGELYEGQCGDNTNLRMDNVHAHDQSTG